MVTVFNNCIFYFLKTSIETGNKVSSGKEKGTVYTVPRAY